MMKTIDKKYLKADIKRKDFCLTKQRNYLETIFCKHCVPKYDIHIKDAIAKINSPADYGNTSNKMQETVDFY